jgi:hypothetical protein
VGLITGSVVSSSDILAAKDCKSPANKLLIKLHTILKELVAG